MTTAGWAAICDAAYIDRFGRLYLFGLDASAPVRTLPTGIHRLSIVIHLPDRVADDESDVALFVTSPDGEWRVADGVRDFCVESHGSYLLVHLPGVRLEEEGLYRFEVTCGAREPLMCQLSVLASSQRQGRVCVRGAH